MTNLGTLAPQAYTRDVLVKAFEWLSTQPEVVRERVPTADSLVAMYLQAKRRGLDGENSHLASAASSAAFQNELKTLAEGLKQFESPVSSPPTIKTQGSRVEDDSSGLGWGSSLGSEQDRSSVCQANSLPQENKISPCLDLRTQSQSGTHLKVATAAGPQSLPGPQSPQHLPNPQNPTTTNGGLYSPQNQQDQTGYPSAHHSQSPQSLFDRLDFRSREYIQEYQRRLNLSCEAEALRSLIALGYDRAREFLPR